MIERAMDVIIQYRSKEVCPEIHPELNKEADALIKEWKKKVLPGLFKGQSKGL